MKKLTLTFVGYDSWDRPVYKAGGNLYVDTDPREGWPPHICTKCNNEFDGEPDCPVNAEFEFIPQRVLW